MHTSAIAPSKTTSVAFFITPHGLGHAARAAGVMEAMGRRIPDFHPVIFTSIPQWFFADSLQTAFSYHHVVADVGLVQQTPLEADYGQTLDALRRLMPFDREMVAEWAETLIQLNCQAVLCDIAPLGIAVAHKANIPSVLVENFTWDWIYAEYAADDDRMTPFVDYCAELFASATYHIQAEPVCFHKCGAAKTKPASRQVRTPAAQIRRKLGIAQSQKLVLVTMGGVPDDFDFIQALRQHHNVCFVLMGIQPAADETKNVIHLPRRSIHHHPDLVNAADLVVGKAGYSTVAEIYHAGVPFGYVSRPHFREAAVLARFVERHIPSGAIAEADFYSGRWLEYLPELLSLPRIQRREINGADQIAEMMSAIVSRAMRNQMNN